MSNKTLTPRYAIVVYDNGFSEGIYIEKGDFVKKGENYNLEGMRPFVDDELRKLQTVLTNDRGLYFDDLISSNLLYVSTSPGNAIIMWMEKKGKRFMNFKDEKIRGEYMVPDTLFMVHNSDIYIYLIKEKDAGNISMNTIAYQSHYYNVWNDQKLCIGTGYKPNVDYMGVSYLMNNVTKDFFSGSYFTHPNQNNEDIIKIWNKEKGVYPENKWKKTSNIRTLLSRFVKV